MLELFTVLNKNKIDNSIIPGTRHFLPAIFELLKNEVGVEWP
jgi:hypothetical protein